MLLTHTRRFRTAAWVKMLSMCSSASPDAPHAWRKMTFVWGNDDRNRIDPSAHPFGERGASQVPLFACCARSHSGSESTKEACGNFVNNGLPPTVFCRGDNQLDTY